MTQTVAHHHLDDAVAPTAGPGRRKSVLIPTMVGIVIGTIFVSIFLAAFHAPKPHHLPVGVVGTAAQVAAVERQLPPGLLDVTRYATAGEARSAIEDRTIFGAYVPGAELLYAGANGPAVLGTLQGLLPAPKATDVLPTSPGDTRSLSIFYAGFGLVLAGFLFGIVSYQMAPRLELRLRVLSLAAFALVGGTVTTLIAGHAGFNALPGSLPALASVAILLALAVGAATMLLMRVAGPAGTLLASLTLLILGNATGGGTLPAAYLPVWLSPLAHALPVGLGIRALQGVSYFHHDGYLAGVALLAVWAVGSLGIILLADLRRSGRE